ncbi:hypothetical protein C8R45DRAFT_926990 [Mycena sanguinolenta]|nr:hypothetical protein C8R45DRAFT_926990 [Mycena sanguinolenta]
MACARAKWLVLASAWIWLCKPFCRLDVSHSTPSRYIPPSPLMTDSLVFSFQDCWLEQFYQYGPPLSAIVVPAAVATRAEPRHSQKLLMNLNLFDKWVKAWAGLGQKVDVFIQQNVLLAQAASNSCTAPALEYSC